MASIEQERTIRTLRARPPSERPVFAAEGGRRRRLLRLAGLGAAVVALVWLGVLAIAMLGFGRLPSVPFPHGVRGGGQEEAKASRPQPADRRARTSMSRAPAAAAARRPTLRLRGTPSRPRPALPTPSSQLPAAPALPAAVTSPAQTPPSPRQGWAQRGWTAPPGLAKRDAPVPPGQARRTTTTPTTPAAGSVPPGQQDGKGGPAPPKG